MKAPRVRLRQSRERGARPCTVWRHSTDACRLRSPGAPQALTLSRPNGQPRGRPNRCPVGRQGTVLEHSIGPGAALATVEELGPCGCSVVHRESKGRPCSTPLSQRKRGERVAAPSRTRLPRGQTAGFVRQPPSPAGAEPSVGESAASRESGTHEERRPSCRPTPASRWAEGHLDGPHERRILGWRCRRRA
jgi:hypothetical protein